MNKLTTEKWAEHVDDTCSYRVSPYEDLGRTMSNTTTPYEHRTVWFTMVVVAMATFVLTVVIIVAVIGCFGLF